MPACSLKMGGLIIIIIASTPQGTEGTTAKTGRRPELPVVGRERAGMPPSEGVFTAHLFYSVRGREVVQHSSARQTLTAVARLQFYLVTLVYFPRVSAVFCNCYCRHQLLIITHSLATASSPGRLGARGASRAATPLHFPPPASKPSSFTCRPACPPTTMRPPSARSRTS